MSEDNVNQNLNDDSNKEIEQLKKEKAAMELKLKKSDDELYSEEYLAFLQEQKKKTQPQNSFMSGGRLTDYSEEELQNMPISKLSVLMRNDVYNQLKSEEDRKFTNEEAKERKKRVAETREEIKLFAKDNPDFWNYVAKIDELADQNPNLNTKQLYILAGGKLKDKELPPKQEAKREIPNTRATVEAGVKQSDKNLSRREIIQQEYQKLK